MFKIYSSYGIFIALALIVYFLILKLIGLNEYPALSVVNGLIYGVGLYLALKKFGSSRKEIEYDKGFELGMFTGGIASIIFTVFMALYMYQFDVEFARNMMSRWSFETSLGTTMLIITILTMGLITTLILTFTFMQLFKRSWNTKDGNRNTL